MHIPATTNFVPCIAVAALLALAVPADAADAVLDACAKAFGDAKACACASERATDYLGRENYARYSAFFQIFVEMSAKDTQTADSYIGPWDSAMGRYAKQYDEEYFAVMGWVPDMEAVHRYALKACGLQSDPEDDTGLIFFWGERR